MSSILVVFKGIIIRCFMWVLQLMPRKRTAIFNSFDRKQYSCNPEL